MLRTIMALLLSIMAATVFANASNNHCPSVKDIKRTSGEFSWYSQMPGWTGHFAYPLRAKGNSTHVTGFVQTRWIQLTNLENSEGYFECDYQGNFGNEMIQFVQAGTMAHQKPADSHWSCQLNPNFPGVQCTCSASAELCQFELVDNSPAPQPIYIDPAATGVNTSNPDIDEFTDK